MYFRLGVDQARIDAFMLSIDDARPAFVETLETIRETMTEPELIAPFIEYVRAHDICFERIRKLDSKKYNAI